MKVRDVKAMYFSATGTTEKVVTLIAERLATQTGGKVVSESFDFTLPEKRLHGKTFSGDDLVVFGLPVYAGRVPNVLLKYLAEVKGGGALAVPVVLYGNRDYDDALIELRDILERGGFRTIAAAAFIGEHSFSRILASGRPDEADGETAEKFSDRVARLLEAGEPKSPVSVTGQTPLRGYYQPRDRKGNSVDIRKVLPKVKDSCSKCGLCVQVCPMGSIEKNNVNLYTGICIKCGACIKKCPENARYYDDPGYLYHQHELEEGYIRRAEPELFLSETEERP